jgi:hypothetical protein
MAPSSYHFRASSSSKTRSVDSSMKSVTRIPMGLHHSLMTTEKAHLGSGILNFFLILFCNFCSAKEQSDRSSEVRHGLPVTTMGSRPSPAAASRAEALRRTLRRSPPRRRLCSTPPLSPGPHTPACTENSHERVTQPD